MNKWFEDSNGNRCSTDYFGTEAEAQAALASLKECKGCVDCSRCSDCSGCSGLYSKTGMEPQPREFKAPTIPVIQNIHTKIYEAVSQPKALAMETWHTYETTHCRGGWVVALAGEEGKALEAFHNTDLAARLIYEASGYKINPARFHDSNEVAMADMKRLAEDEVAK